VTAFTSCSHRRQSWELHGVSRPIQILEWGSRERAYVGVVREVHRGVNNVQSKQDKYDFAPGPAPNQGKEGWEGRGKEREDESLKLQFSYQIDTPAVWLCSLNLSRLSRLV
jgi:hypothetical protein